MHHDEPGMTQSNISVIITATTATTTNTITLFILNFSKFSLINVQKGVLTGTALPILYTVTVTHTNLNIG